MPGKKDIVLKYPNGWRGITSVTTNEDLQEEIFLPTEGMLVAVNVEKADVDFGTPVCDLKDNDIDPDRIARLQSLFRVIKYPEGQDNCALALQLGQSGNKDTKGYFVDRKGGGDPVNQTSDNPNGDPAPNKQGGIAIAKGSYFDGGPFDCGTGKCRHKVGEDDEGNPVSSLHLSTRALFRRNDLQDGPLLFEQTIPPPNVDLDKRISVHLSWDPGARDWYWWTTSPMVPLYPLNDPLTGTPTQPPPNYPGIPGLPQPGTPTIPTGPSQTPTTGTPIDPNGYPSGPNVPGLPLTPVDLLTVRNPGTTPIVNGLSNIGLWMLALSSPALAAGLGFRPQNYRDGQLDTGTFAPQTAAGSAKAKSAPISGIFSGFAAQGGTTAAAGGYGPSQSGAQGDPWSYNQQPWRSKVAGGRNSRYPGGTASGGIVFHPPETDLRDAAKLAMQPSNVTLSTSLVVCSPSAYFAAGTPNLVNGSLKDGHSWGMEPSTGDFVVYSHSNSQARSESMRLTKTAQTIRWRAGQSVYGELTHANSANRQYTFPDATGTVVLSQSPIADGGGAILLNGHVGGSGPASTTPKLAKIRLADGQDYFIEVYQ